MNKKLLQNIIIFFVVLAVNTGQAQGFFRFDKPTTKKEVVSFKLLSNLIIFPMEVNDKKLNFILDSGVGSTIIFNMSSVDSLNLKNLRSIKLRGLGDQAPVDAIHSDRNTFKLKSITGHNQKLFVVFDDSFDLSSKLGLTIHGIIGFDLLKDFVVNINYVSKRLTFYNRDYYEKEQCKKCQFFKLQFDQKKPYIDVGVKLNNSSEKITPVKLLIDSGGSDAMWLFQNSHPDIVEPVKFFRDFLGEGLSGTIYGKRTYIKSLVIGEFELPNPTVSYPDSSAVSYARRFVERNGSLGGSILKRFSVTFDYRNALLGLKKASSFKKPFRYNMSGIELVYNGKILVKEHDKNRTSFSLTGDSDVNEGTKIYLDYKFKYSFKPSYKIFKIREGSPAYRAGLLENDLIIKINGNYTYDMELEEIVSKFYEKEGNRITLLIERGGQNYTYRFHLENVLK